MRIESVTLKGILRFAEAATLDLRDVDAGLVAVVGKNGEGKSGTLEAVIACLFGEFPSRTLGVANRHLVDYATGPDSFIEVDFAMDGDGLYRARRNIDGLHRKTDAVLCRVNPDGSLLPLTDGKVTSFDAKIAELLPPLSSLLASVFSSQNRKGSFVMLDKKGRKELFGALLGLEAYDTYAGRAKSAESLTQQEIERLHGRRELLARDTGADVEQQLDLEANRLQAEGGTIEARRVELQRDLTAIEGELAGLVADAATHAAAQTSVDRLEGELQAGTLERVQASAALERLNAEAKTELEDLLAGMERAATSTRLAMASTSERDDAISLIDRRLTKDLAELDQRIAKNEQVRTHGDEIRTAAKTVADLDVAITRGREDERRVGHQIEATQRRERVLAQALTDIATKARELARARTDAALLGTVPCGGAGDYAACQFLTAAAAAQAQIPGLQEAVRSRGVAEQEQKDLLAEIAQRQAERAALAQDLAQKEAQRAAAHAVAVRLPDLNAAEERIAGHEARKTELQADAERQRAEVVAREARRQADLKARQEERLQQHAAQLQALERRVTTRREELAGRIDALAQRLTALTFERENLRDQLAVTKDASERAAAQNALMALRRREWDETGQALARVTHRREDLDRRLEAVRTRRQELAQVDAAIAGKVVDIDDWRLLAKALGRDGLPTLEIDAAGPTVSAFCNDLLQSCFGSRFTVELVTQEAKAKKSKDGDAFKEVFELRVFDSLRGGDARELADLSGGEQVLVDEALKSAIALLVNTRNQSPIRTAWRDETTGALDGDNAAKYVDMLRRVQQLGGFQHVLFVSHNPDAALQADVQVVVGGGRIEVRQPPYGAAA